ncbi:hypothetical protein VTJ04DRAFT_287 [Mycothermus thermophilus]|uniref:uncharacterized protein n=1 Tax=Humicola insolens TaxID=85995 RepID=UPI0037431EBD
MGKDKKPQPSKKDSKDDKGGKAAGGKKGKNDNAEDSGKATKLKGAQSINVRHILCEKFSKSEEAMQRLKNGESFDKVAKEMSEDKAKAGGSLGWQSKGNLDPKFEEVAFNLAPSTVNQPVYERVKTQFGYHIIMVEGRK